MSQPRTNTRRVREIKEMLEAEGIEWSGISYTSKGHIKVMTLVGPMIFSGSPSDHRGMRQARAEARRAKRGMQS